MFLLAVLAVIGLLCLLTVRQVSTLRTAAINGFIAAHWMEFRSLVLKDLVAMRAHRREMPDYHNVVGVFQSMQTRDGIDRRLIRVISGLPRLRSTDPALGKTKISHSSLIDKHRTVGVTL